jgi:hypothetical protein
VLENFLQNSFEIEGVRKKKRGVLRIKEGECKVMVETKTLVCGTCVKALLYTKKIT